MSIFHRHSGNHTADTLAIPVGDALTQNIPTRSEPHTPWVRAQLARLVDQAETTHEGNPTQAWDRPDDLLPDHRDTWSALARNYVHPADATRPAPPRPYSGISAIWVEQITYPDPGLSFYLGRDYRETLRHIGAATGTSTSLEDTGSWPRLALEAGDAA